MRKGGREAGREGARGMDGWSTRLWIRLGSLGEAGGGGGEKAAGATEGPKWKAFFS